MCRCRRSLSRRVDCAGSMVHGSLLSHPNAHIPLYGAREALATEKGYHMHCICLLCEWKRNFWNLLHKRPWNQLLKVTRSKSSKWDFLSCELKRVEIYFVWQLSDNVDCKFIYKTLQCLRGKFAIHFMRKIYLML
jgi:hypothetical protein